MTRQLREPHAGSQGAQRCILGYAWSLTNAARDVRLVGSPKEVVDAARELKLDLADLVDHPATEIDATEVYRDAPGFSFSGGPHAETVLELFDAIQRSDIRKAAEVLRADPGAVKPAQSGSAVPLLAAVAAGHLEITRQILAAGAHVDAPGQFDMTALHWAAALGLPGVAKVLREAGADPDRLSWFYLTAGELATINGHEEMAGLLADQASARTGSASLDSIMGRMKATAAQWRS